MRWFPPIDSLEAELADPAMAPDTAVGRRERPTWPSRPAEDTSRMLAMRGRAAYTGERSIGSVDAGATAIGVILQAIA